MNLHTRALFSAVLFCGMISWMVRAEEAPKEAPPAPVKGWLTLRGPQQNGCSLETGLPAKWALKGENDLWTIPLPGRGSPVIANGKLYTMAYEGEGEELREELVCLDPETGKRIWAAVFEDFLSDIIYNRYSIGSPAIDPETGNIYAMGAAGIFACYTPDGKEVWHHSMMEELGQMTFPNGRVGSPIVDGEFVIMHYITTNWGAQGPACDRYYGFEKKSGRLVWSCTPSLIPSKNPKVPPAAVQPHDNSFCLPVLAWQNGKRVAYVTTGCGDVACFNVRNGEPLWRYPISQSGINTSVILYKDKVIAIQGLENLDAPTHGRMTAVKIGAEPPAGEPGPVLLNKSSEAWRIDDLVSFSSSPILLGNRIYQTTENGELVCIDPDAGKVLWQKKLANKQEHASLLAADGRLYVPLKDGLFYILNPTDAGVEELSKVEVEGECLSAPVAWNGKVYLHTTEKFYCFGKAGDNAGVPAPLPIEKDPAPGPKKQIVVVPNEVLLRPGLSFPITLREVDANGFLIGETKGTKWERFVPTYAKVQATLNATFSEDGMTITGGSSNEPSAGMYKCTVDGVDGYIRGRAVAELPVKEDFEGFKLHSATDDDKAPLFHDPGVPFAYPPLPWLGARFKWDVREVGGSKVLAKIVDANMRFQRSFVFFGHPDKSDYTVAADVMSDGDKQKMSEVGLINQRYCIILKGNSQELEINSNLERLREAVPFAWESGKWYRLKTRVEHLPDGVSWVQAKAWERGKPEPEAWTLALAHKNGHANGSPGLFGFNPADKAVYIDNLAVTANDPKERASQATKIAAVKAPDGPQTAETPVNPATPNPAAVETKQEPRVGDWNQWGGRSDRNMASDEKNITDDFDPGKKKEGTVNEIDPATMKNIKWAVDLGSQSYGNQTIANGKIYVGTNNKGQRDPKYVGDRGVMMCFDEATGKFLWQLVCPKLASGKANDWEELGICSSPTVVDDRVYVVTNRCELVCLTTKGMTEGKNEGPFTDEGQYFAGPGSPPVKPGPLDADIVWIYDMKEELGVYPHNASSCSVIVLGDLVYTGTSNGQDWTHRNIPSPNAPCLIAVDRKTGKLVAKDDAKVGTSIFHGQWSSPTLITVNGKPQLVFGAGNGVVYAFDPTPVKEGDEMLLKKVWWYDCNPKERKFLPDGRKRGYPTREGPSEIIATPVFYKNRIYIAVGQDPEHGTGLGMLHCIDATKKGDVTQSGKVWSFDGVKVPGEGEKGMMRTISTASLYNGLVFISDHSGNVHCVDADTGKECWNYNCRTLIWGGTFAVDGKVFVGNEAGELLVFKAQKEANEPKKIKFPAKVRSTPVVSNGVMYVELENRLYAIQAGAAAPKGGADAPAKKDDGDKKGGEIPAKHDTQRAAAGEAPEPSGTTAFMPLMALAALILAGFAWKSAARG
ncbi:MAG: PQQ-binding-like beta-propeller repeat protein [Planctomycetes bacterium]|nr:PQQ-binding-like beta-propeller repeat protein [Planctomycetota bacterium]